MYGVGLVVEGFDEVVVFVFWVDDDYLDVGVCEDGLEEFDFGVEGFFWVGGFEFCEVGCVLLEVILKYGCVVVLIFFVDDFGWLVDCLGGEWEFSSGGVIEL